MADAGAAHLAQTGQAGVVADGAMADETPQEDRGIGLSTKGTAMPAQLSLPAFVEPMLATRGQPFDSHDYLFEIEWDGIRMLAFID